MIVHETLQEIFSRSLFKVKKECKKKWVIYLQKNIFSDR